MALLPKLIAQGEVCCCLRAKTMFYDTPDHDTPESLESQKHGPFWCAVTQSLIGPDGKFAGLDHCRQGTDRSCCRME